MNVSCPDCGSVFRVDPAKVPPVGVRARCSVCGGVWHVGPDAPSPEPISAVHAAAEAGDSVGGIAVREPVPESPLASVAEPTPEPASVVAPVVEDRGPAPSSAPEPAEAGSAPSAPTPDAAPARPGRPVNPYLNNSPEQRARRLARALVSDLVAYNPQKREQGLRDGTLRQLFREEIRKSWDEYVEQVGPAIAESTPHFQDALNDVLAGGRRVF